MHPALQFRINLTRAQLEIDVVPTAVKIMQYVRILIAEFEAMPQQVLATPATGQVKSKKAEVTDTKTTSPTQDKDGKGKGKGGKK